MKKLVRKIQFCANFLSHLKSFDPFSLSTCCSHFSIRKITTSKNLIVRHFVYSWVNEKRLMLKYEYMFHADICFSNMEKWKKMYNSFSKEV